MSTSAITYAIIILGVESIETFDQTWIEHFTYAIIILGVETALPRQCKRQNCTRM